DDEEGGCPKGGVLAQVLASDLVQQDGGHYAGDIADQEGGGTRGESGRGDGADQRWIEGEEGDQVACIASRAVTVGGEVEVVLRVPVVPGATEGGQGIGRGPEFDQGEGDEHGLDQKGQQQQAQPRPHSIGVEPPDWKCSGTIATQRLAGRRAA